MTRTSSGLIRRAVWRESARREARVFPADDDAVDDQGGIRRGRSRGAYFLNILHFPVPIDPQKALALEVAQSRRRILGQQGFRRSGQDQARLFRQGDEFLRNLVRAFAHQFLARFRVMGSAGQPHTGCAGSPEFP